jgi:four helix bundle protein
MPGSTGRPKYDLEERTFQFARQVRNFVKQLPHTVCNQEDVRQLARSSGAVGANYIEANNALGKKDFLMRVRISRKEANESSYFLRLLDTSGLDSLNAERTSLVQESAELVKIFGGILKNSERSPDVKSATTAQTQRRDVSFGV